MTKLAYTILCLLYKCRCGVYVSLKCFCCSFEDRHFRWTICYGCKRTSCLLFDYGQVTIGSTPACFLHGQ
ncbi:hypothetical protein PF005_g15264 [Phytophthora fragariae]|uniref:Secreted protein n=1 Tax=Phytophthora fragariae TaxID=53985 RepID=A0A6A4D0U5_9STRA|nr:hypothetical protein PF003_g25103 [Phytophthora fragariae]KAE8940484.1 hypothetical protein PF009_g9703 [Phytophthora fragariae]KAE9099187.1 hypothetical protein PF007_g15970 [Phytophthora fragariae]KAE9133104.1 hypothetical protein PF006_g15117 [Phytophthora fragariae]KAE9200657.1 hypothetical protein PF005_g15264 [Phytophthora fragariae]